MWLGGMARDSDFGLEMRLVLLPSSTSQCDSSTTPYTRYKLCRIWFEYLGGSDGNTGSVPNAAPSHCPTPSFIAAFPHCFWNSPRSFAPQLDHYYFSDNNLLSFEYELTSLLLFVLAALSPASRINFLRDVSSPGQRDTAFIFVLQIFKEVQVQWVAIAASCLKTIHLLLSLMPSLFGQRWRSRASYSLLLIHYYDKRGSLPLQKDTRFHKYSKIRNRLQFLSYSQWFYFWPIFHATQ